MTMVPPEWTTVSDAARRLGLSDRHARRIAEKLSDQDRLKEERGPLRVRLIALTELWERESSALSRMQAQNEAEAAALADAISRARLEERLEAAEVLIVELKDDKQRLQEILQREQENHRRLLDQIYEERRDQRLMHARSVPMFTPAPNSETLKTESPEETLGTAPSVPPAEVSVTPEPPRLNFWQRLAHWISD